MKLKGHNESYALLPISANPPPIEAFAGLGAHAIAFSGEVSLQGQDVVDLIKQLKNSLDDEDDAFTWDLDIVVGPRWRSVKTAAPMAAVTNVFTTGADEDDTFQFAVSFRDPKWTIADLGGEEKIVLHVTIKQAGESLRVLRLGYCVTATGDLRNPAGLVP
jgi:hypothetical protein